MALRLSTGLRQALLGSADFKTSFTLSQVNIYTGTQPAAANDVPTGTLLASITVSGGATGLTFDAPAAGVISKAVAEAWSGTAAATGTAGWFRLFVKIEDPATSSTTLARVDGAISTSGAELNMSSTAITSGAVQTVTSFDITLPAA